jgi:hypothetical protein
VRKKSINNRQDEMKFNSRCPFLDVIFFFVVFLEDDLDILLEQLHTLEQRLDRTKMFRNEPIQRHKKSISPSIVAQFDELDQALATLTSTLNNVEIELVDSGNSSSSSAVSESTTIPHHQRQDDIDDKHNEGDEHFSDSGLSQSTDSISLPYKQQSQIRTNSQLSNASSVRLRSNLIFFNKKIFLKRFFHVTH